MSITFSGENGLPNTVFFNFFIKKPQLNESRKKTTGLKAHFPPYLWFFGPIVSKNNRVHSWVEPHQSCEFHENWFKTMTCIVTSYTYINI